MNIKDTKYLQNWEKATKELTDYFVIKYWGKECIKDYYWVADAVGEVMFINDHFFNLTDIVDFLKNKYTEDELWEYLIYREQVICKEKFVINPKNWKKLNKK